MPENNRNKKRLGWLPPTGAAQYFSYKSDFAFQKRHPIGYFFLVILSVIALTGPMALYNLYMISTFGDDLQWTVMLGLIGSFSIGVGLFNFAAIIIKQYLGHLVSVISLVFGFIMVALSFLL